MKEIIPSVTSRDKNGKHTGVVKRNGRLNEGRMRTPKKIIFKNQLPELITEFINVRRYKVNIQKSIALLYSKHLEIRFSKYTIYNQ